MRVAPTSVAAAIAITFNATHDLELQRATNSAVVERLGPILWNVLSDRHTREEVDEIMVGDLESLTAEEVRAAVEQYLCIRDWHNKRPDVTGHAADMCEWLDRLVDAIVFITLTRPDDLQKPSAL